MVPWGGVSCYLSAAALYLLGRSSGSTITRYDIQSVAFGCHYIWKSRSVQIHQSIVEQHFLKHNDAGSWIHDSTLMLSMCKEVPWYLVRNSICITCSRLQHMDFQWWQLKMVV